jgi:transcriptional regulator with GAF, ATPase, and Fis domain
VGSEAIELGREMLAEMAVDDDRTSRRHTRVSYSRDGWRIEDLGSRNGTFVEGERLVGVEVRSDPRVIRLGRCIFLPVSDVRPFQRDPVDSNKEGVIGPSLGAVWREIAQIANSADDDVLLTGESGVGKELAARAFHRFGPHPNGPFVAVNCATIPQGVAERLLFGTRKGTYSGADADAMGYIQAADGGTLFLDEIGELDPAVQPKLLRALETREVVPLGASRGKRVDVRICSATLRDLPKEVSAGRFRPDLFFRIGRARVHVPPLRERLEEIPWLIWREASSTPTLSVHPSFVEACLLRAWPGNVRELCAETRRALRSAQLDLRLDVAACDLSATAGLPLDAEADARDSNRPASSPPRDDDAIAAALREHGGNVTAAARSVGLHRNQIRRWLARRGPDSWR